MKLTGSGEFQIIDYLKKRSGSAPGLIRGIGDDCAVTTIASGEVLLTTTDLLIEDIHFKQQWTELAVLGRKAVSVNVSDLAAMGAEPRFLFLSLAIPDCFELTSLDQLLTGFLAACADYGAVLAGGDTCRSASGLTLSVTAQGVAPESGWIGRDGAHENEGIYLTGTVGDSALALNQLQSGEVPDQALLQRHNDPIARVAVGRALAKAGIPTAMIDISDGLLGDLEHILVASDVGAAIELENLPLSPGFERELKRDSALLDLALTGGEDYELLFTAPKAFAESITVLSGETGVPIQKIGSISKKRSEITLYGPAGEYKLPAKTGYKHFPEST